MSSRREDGTVTRDFLDEQPKFKVDIFSELVEHPVIFVEVVLCGKFISIYKIFHSFAALTREIFFNTRREISSLRAAM